MKIKTKILSNFLRKTIMDGTQKIDEAILNFEKDGLKITANSKAQQSRVTAWLKKEAFKEYEEFGNVGMNELSTVINVLNRFEEFVTIKKEGNLLTIKGDNKKVDVELVSEDFLKTDTGEPALEWDETFNMTSTALKGIFNDVTINKDAVIQLETKNKTVTFSNTGKYKFENTIKAETCKGGTKVKFGEPLIDATKQLDGNLEISVKTDYPTKVMEKSETSVISFIIAPRVDEE